MRKRRNYISSSLVILFFLILWQLGAALYNKPFILPTPAEIAAELWELKVVLLIKHLPATMAIILIGLAFSVAIGIILAVLMNFSKSAKRAFYPILIASQTIPVIALAPIFVLWFGYSIWSKIVVTVLITFFPITVSTFDGLRSVSKDLKELMLTMGAGKREVFLKLSVPSALPHFFSGLKVAVTLSVIGAAIGEWLGAEAGLGYFSRRMMTQFNGAAVFAPIVLLSIAGIVLFLLVTLCENIFLKWRKSL
ncbi:ABC transporter permease [Rossellomorea vietnamensis]|uniref:ABC transporter permease n=1 Tax=Rossellomorea vietnamensis TaxID=218284 RepID=A0A5D4NLL2_9BACI|nr:ABC transporter permease [Rossellomorea vietnamensis]TYS15017.1 ABC transporter permease [Rossellomorea vietnamensis]